MKVPKDFKQTYKEIVLIKNFGYQCNLQWKVPSVFLHNIHKYRLYDNQGGRGHWTVNYTGTQSFIAFVGINTLGTFLILDWLKQTFSVYTF